MLLTNTYGLGQIDKEAYSLLLKESTALSDLGFEGYNPGSYKIRFYDGKNDYVVEAEDKITKEKNVY